LTAYNGLANRRLQPLGHVSGLDIFAVSRSKRYGIFCFFSLKSRHADHSIPPMESLEKSLAVRLELTDLAIQNFKFQHPQVTYWDTMLPAFGVRVGSRSKTFIVMHGQARKRQTAGRYPSLKLSDARELAKAVRLFGNILDAAMRPSIA
jgi:hypothetical protein